MHDARATSLSRADIEDITQRTGSFKKFAVFTQMLLSALEAVSYTHLTLPTILLV